MTAVFSDFWHWWIDTARDAFSIALSKKRRDDSTLVVEICAGDLVALGRASGSYGVVTKTEPFPIQQLSAQLSSVFGNFDTKHTPLVVRLRTGRFVLRQLSALVLPASKIKAAAELDLVSATPFKRGDVHILAFARQGAGSAYAIINKSVVDPGLALLCSNNLTPTQLELETETGLVRLPAFEIPMLERPKRGFSGLFLKASTVGIAFALIATVGHLRMKNQQSLAALHANVERLTADAKVVRQVLDKRSAAMQKLVTLRKNYEESQAVTAVWEELARVLPDSAYLTDLDIRERKVAIGGYAKQAADLVVALEQSSMFSKASFTAPVVNSPGQDGERFQISLETGGAN